MSPCMKLVAIGLVLLFLCLGVMVGVGSEIGWHAPMPRWLFECFGAASIVTLTGCLGFRFEIMK